MNVLFCPAVFSSLHLTFPISRSCLMIPQTDCNEHVAHLSSSPFKSRLSSSFPSAVRPLDLRIASLFSASSAEQLTKTQQDEAKKKRKKKTPRRVIFLVLTWRKSAVLRWSRCYVWVAAMTRPFIFPSVFRNGYFSGGHTSTKAQRRLSAPTRQSTALNAC